MKSICLILGAGASVPFGYPTGSQLKELIIDDFSRRDSLLKKDNLAFPSHDSLARFIKDFSRSDAPSIDRYLKSNVPYFNIGKRAVFSMLASMENEKKLINPHKEDDWFSYLFNKLFGSDAEDIAHLKIVTFNYDRSIEFLVENFFRKRYPNAENLREVISEKVEIRHMYGILTENIFDPTRPAYGKITDIRAQAYDGETIYSEKTDAFKRVRRARESMSKCSCFIFLGFGYHRFNLKRLVVPFGNSRIPIVGSCYGVFDERERNRIESQCRKRKFLGDPQQNSLEFLQNCEELHDFLKTFEVVA